MSYYELWELDGGKLIKTFSTKAEALDYVRVMIERAGVDSLDEIGLGYTDTDGNQFHVADGERLVALAVMTASAA